MCPLPSTFIVHNSTSALSCFGPKLYTDQPYHIRDEASETDGTDGTNYFRSPERLADAPEIALSASKGLAETNPFVFLANLAILTSLRARFCFPEH